MVWLKRAGCKYLYMAALLTALVPSAVAASAFFDVHLHYSSDDADTFSPANIVQKLDASGVRYAAVTGSPAVHVSHLHAHAPDRIVPLLSVYRRSGDKETWTQDQTLPAYVDLQLEQGHWRGIGELHIFAGNRHSVVFKKVVESAVRHELPLMLHADPAVIDTLYEMAPQQSVIWAHAGTFPYPDLLADYLNRYPMLRIDLSKRDERIAPQGQLADDWYELLVAYPDRFMVGVDTYSIGRWQRFHTANQAIRHWLAQLPGDVAQKLAYDNAAAFFAVNE